MKGRSGGLARKTGLLAVVSALSMSGGGYAGAASLSAPPADRNSWTVYHGDAAGSGVAAPVSAVNTTARAWTSPTLDGKIYGEPLVSSGRVYVATENDTVYALSAATGAVVWSSHVGTPVPSGSLPCGDISPTVGITGTPVIDQARGEIFAVADELVSGKSAHMVVGLALASGQREMTRNVDPAGVITAALLQRTGLALDAGQVVFGFGGNDGDCSTYRGWLVAVGETGGTPVDFAVDAGPGQSQGAIWMGGAAPAVDRGGHLWVSVGNGSVSSPGQAYDNSDSILELSSSLRLMQFFAPASWRSNNANDLDLSAEPALLPGGQVLAAGKTHAVYLLNGARLGGIGGQEATLGSACDSDMDGGNAVLGSVVYLPCLSGVAAVRAAQSPAGLRLMWRSGAGGGPPIVAAGLVWTIARDGTLSGLSPDSGAVRQQAAIGPPANHFPTPSVGDGLLLAPSAEQVVAFTATASGASVTGPATTAPGAARTGDSSGPPGAAGGAGVSSGTGAGVVAGVVAGGVAVIGGAGWFLWRRRAGGTGKHVLPP
jgi:polyvinyl alcohol dehydrogenase (cytochrome)